ncbi:MAG: type I DNA topoisomerase [Phycisphaerae bacterium]
MAKTKKQSAAKSDSANGKSLVIVESPAKAKTINRYLGDNYIVKASMGHVRDLPKKEMGVDLEHDFSPKYEPLQGKKKMLSELRKDAKKAEKVYLATDLDREGEAIAWHLAESLKVPEERIRRVVFNEITAPAIRAAFEHPRGIDMNKVNAQQARRILDRIVGYEVSPLLWKKVARGLSAGRVQTVAVRLIVEREREIEAFIPDEYWKVSAIFTTRTDQAQEIARRWAELLSQTDEKGNPPTKAAQQEFLSEHDSFRAELVTWKGDKFASDNADESLDIVRALGLEVEDVIREEDPKGKGPAKNLVTVVAKLPEEKAGQFSVTEIKKRQSKSKPPAPFRTASLQQAASTRLRFAAQRTMRIAQQLYEGIDIPGEGHAGLITYMRTDSAHLSSEAIRQVRGYIGEQFGGDYLPEKPNFYAARGRTQEAHEAIRPTDATRHPDELRSILSPDQYQLYRLIWQRFVGCQMKPAIWEVTDATISADTPDGRADFKASGRTLKFPGFYKVAGLPKGGDQILPALDEGQTIAGVDVNTTQHFTLPPARYSEASLVRALEADGIGRPSTYAAIIQTIQDRKYVEQENRSFRPTDLGRVVADKLIKHFPSIFDVRFTANLENQLDDVEDEGKDWVRLLKEFYGPFHQKLDKAMENMVHAKAETEPAPHTCPECGAGTMYRFGKNGRFLSCAQYPECKYAAPVDREGNPKNPEQTDIACPECGSAMMLRKGRYGPFLSCTRYPDCSGIVNLDRKGFIKHPSPPPLLVEDIKCPKCEAPVNLRRGKRGPWMSCSKYPKCRGRVAWSKLDDDVKQDLEGRLKKHEAAHPQPRVKTLEGEDVGDQYKPQVTEVEPAEK